MQVLESNENQAGGHASAKEEHKLEKKHLALINKMSVYHRMLERKHLFSWHNMTISQATVNQLLENQDWYVLTIPPEKLEPSHYERVREWEDLAVDLICEYANQYWRRERNIWEHKYIEAVPLDNHNANYFDEYELSVDTKEEGLIKDIEQLAKEVAQGNYEKEIKLPSVQLSLLAPAFHAYIPLLQASVGAGESVKISPLALNDGEADFVEYLKVIVKNQNIDFLQGKEIYLMRNLSRGKGVSFFDDYSFYPDFILWVRDSNRQDILFIDPKGLVHFDSKIKSKVDLHKRIKKTEKKIKEKNPEIFLHSYIWSATLPKEIGSDCTMTEQDCRKQGIFLAKGKAAEIINLLQHALCTVPYDC